MKNYSLPLTRYIPFEINSRCQGSSSPPRTQPPGESLIPIDCDVEEVSCAEGATPTSNCINSPFINLLAVGFTLVGSTSTETPNCTVTYDGNTYSDCEIPLQFVCDDGVYWQIRCNNVPCGSANPVTINCEGAVQEEPCENVQVTIITGPGGPGGPG